MAEVHARLSIFYYVLVLSAVVLILHLPFFGSPAIHIDEQFYLAVADKWLHHGLVPFVDVWDRKPLGTFILYTLPIALFSNAILGYQLFAAWFVILTCICVLYIGRALFQTVIGFHAALIYAVAVMLMEGAGGQTPIFYNAFIAAAALIYTRTLLVPGREFRNCVLASLLLGGAIQIKYICVLEAAAMSCLMLFALYRRGWSIGGIAVLGLVMSLAGLSPTVAVGLSYAVMGHFREFADANFLSIFAKRLWRLSLSDYVGRLAESSLLCIFFLPFAARGTFRVLRASTSEATTLGRTLLLLWLIAAFVGALALGNPTRHYFLATLAPLALFAAVGLHAATYSTALSAKPLVERPGPHLRIGLLLTVPIVASFIIAVSNPRERGETADVTAIADYLHMNTPPGECPFVFNRLPILYYLADECAPSIYMFPNHLSEIGEVRTPDRRRIDELGRVLASHPPLIYVRMPYSSDIDDEAISMLEETLAADYQVAYVRRGYHQFHVIYSRISSPPMR